MKRLIAFPVTLIVVFQMLWPCQAESQEEWLQFKYDSRHSGNAADRGVTTPLGLVGWVRLTDAIFTAPVVSQGRVYVVDGSGQALCADAGTLRVLWTFQSDGGKANCNNVSSPAVIGDYLHFGTMAGDYYVLDAASGTVVKRIACGDPILGSPVVANGRVYFATLGSRVYALAGDGTVHWTWDFLDQRKEFSGDRWNGRDWLQHQEKRVSASEQFCCSRDMAVHGKTIVVPAGGSVVWLQDEGDSAALKTHHDPRNATLGLSIGKDGTVYRQWTLLDNGGSVNTLALGDDGKVIQGVVKGTRTSTRGGLLSFASVSLRGEDVYRSRLEEGFGLCRHGPQREIPERLAPYPAIAAPIILDTTVVYGDLEGRLHVVPLSGKDRSWSFQTAFGKAISAPAAVAEGRIYLSCEDGYLYVLGPDGTASSPSEDLPFSRVRVHPPSAKGREVLGGPLVTTDPLHFEGRPDSLIVCICVGPVAKTGEPTVAVIRARPGQRTANLPKTQIFAGWRGRTVRSQYIQVTIFAAHIDATLRHRGRCRDRLAKCGLERPARVLSG